MTFSYLLGQAASSLIISEEISAELIVMGLRQCANCCFSLCSLSVGMLRHTPKLSHQTSPNSTNEHVPLITTAEAELGDNRHSPASALPGDRWVWFWPLIVAEGSGGVEEAEGSLTATSPGSARAHGGLHGCPAIRLFYTCSFSENTHTSLYGGSISRRSCGDSLIKIILQDSKPEADFACGF